ncbi:thiol:disulfide oxidoreductase [Iodidimonas nitroreducens]|uniref:Thiol:disulfide oxidoreductase n=1 Tax=Iodidimonas nitroreducens TaxID=1236968 RepID=A0A5A7N9C3_9PROT|nr:glutathione binding-like protein [Iodidimonas nitroreducens]GAK32722.1 disulfide-bond oxidoreductase YfcG [alpha proteobacterium Q-1]GER04941.1 thiol:disulfide oxidoreductase [Iodidimonas nitroreducens]
MDQIEAYLWATPNSRRVTILFEELGLSYHIHAVNIRTGAQFAPEILALNPYGKLPIVTWIEPEQKAGHEAGQRHVLWESGAILIRFAERFGRFLPDDAMARDAVMQWLMVALTSVGPMSGQAHHWTELADEKPLAALRHHQGLVARVYRMLDAHLADRPYLAADYSLADIAAYPWIDESAWTGLRLADFPHLFAWHQRIGARPAVQRAMRLPKGARLD